MISLFAFIVTLGIIVDDAIVVGENIYEKRERGMPAMQASIEGAREIAAPVTFAVMTNIVAFMPMLFVPGSEWSPVPADPRGRDQRVPDLTGRVAVHPAGPPFPFTEANPLLEDRLAAFGILQPRRSTSSSNGSTHPWFDSRPGSTT